MLKYEMNDALLFLAKVPSKYVDLILIDPPYIISRQSGYVNNSPEKKEYIAKYGKHSIDFGETDKYELNLENLFKEFYRVLKIGGTLLVFYDFWKMQELKECAEKHKFKQARLGIWNKTNPVPINSKLNYLTNGREFFVTFVKQSKPTFNSEYDKGDYYIDLPILHGKERTIHPNQKPLALIQQLIEKHSNYGDMILDCFAGSGTTGVACERLGRNCLMCEINPNYIDIIRGRCEVKKIAE